MHIALNAGILRAPRAGIGQYVAGLCQALQARTDVRLELFGGWSWGHELPAAALPGYSRLSSLARRLPYAYRLRRQVEQQRFSQGVRRLQPQLYHEPSLWPFEFDGPMVMTLHDLTHVYYPHTQPAQRLHEIERQVGAGLDRAARVLVDSAYIAGEAQAYYGIAADKLVVAPLGCAARFHPRNEQQLAATLNAFGLVARQYLLCVGTLEPRKNLQVALEAYLALPSALRERFPLLLAGMPGWDPDYLHGSLARAVACGQVRLLGYQTDQVLAELLAGARLLLFPSLYEGFGLPALEAMASGTPAVLSRRAALPEVAGGAGQYFDPEDAQDCVRAVQQLLEDDSMWQQRRSAGLARAPEFSWEGCARITAATYRELLSN